MGRYSLTLTFVLGAVLLGSVARAEEFRPIPAAQAEARVAEVRDAITEVLWIGIDGYWHEGQIEDCLRLNREIVSLDPHFIEAYTNAAWLLWSYDRDAEAVKTYQEGLANNPDDAQLYVDFGFYYRSREQLAKAIPLFREAVAKGARQEDQHLLPDTLEENGQKREALAEWRKLLRRFPTDGVAHMKIARLEKELAPD